MWRLRTDNGRTECEDRARILKQNSQYFEVFSPLLWQFTSNFKEAYARLIIPSSREETRRAAAAEREVSQVSTTLSPPLNLHLTVSSSQSQVLYCWVAVSALCQLFLWIDNIWFNLQNERMMSLCTSYRIHRLKAARHQLNLKPALDR